MAGMMFRRMRGAIGAGVVEKEFAMTLWRFVKNWLKYCNIFDLLISAMNRDN